jgi:hypothetical protein
MFIRAALLADVQLAREVTSSNAFSRAFSLRSNQNGIDSSERFGGAALGQAS